MRITIQEAYRLLKAGEVIAIPTETVYGLAADMGNSAAVQSIFSIKKRPNDRPLITLLSDVKQINPFVEKVPPGFDRLTAAFWPGALTLVMAVKAETISETIRAGLSTAGFRVPNHPDTLELISRFGPVVAPSANLSGHPSPVNAEQVEHYFGQDFPVLDGGACTKGIESTILCFQDGMWKVSRLGAISKEQLESLLSYPLMTTEKKI